MSKLQRRVNRPHVFANKKDLREDKNIIEIFDSSNAYDEQKKAAFKLLEAIIERRSIFHLLMGQTQGGKSEVMCLVARTLSYLFSKSELPVTQDSATRPWTVVYIVALPSNDLEHQAKVMFDIKTHSLNASITVRKMLRIDLLIKELETLGVTPGAFIVDESHLANDPSSKNFPKLIEALRKNWKQTPIICVSATGHSLLREIRDDGYMPALNCMAQITIQRPGIGYRGLVEYHKNNQIIEISSKSLNFARFSPERELFIKNVIESSKRVAFIRVGRGQAKSVIATIEARFSNAKIVKLGERWKGFDQSEMTSLEELHILYANTKSIPHEKDQKIIVLIREGLKAGIDLGSEIKADIAAVWESYQSSFSSVVQGVIARTCGYIDNRSILVFVHFPYLSLYVNALEELYGNGMINPLEDYLSTIAVDSFVKLDSERIRNKKRQTVKQTHYHEIEQITAVDISNAKNYDVTTIANKAARESGDMRMVDVILGAVSKHLKVNNLETRLDDSFKNRKESFHIRHITEKYLFGSRHGYLSLFEGLRDNTLSDHARSFETFATKGSKDDLHDYTVLVCSVNHQNKNGAAAPSREQIQYLMNCVERSENIFKMAGSSEHEFVLFVIKKGAIKTITTQGDHNNVPNISNSVFGERVA